MNKATTIIVGLLVCAIGTGLFAQFLFRYVVTYDIYNDRVRVLLFSLVPVFRIPISEICEAQYYPPKLFFVRPFFALRLGNRLFGDGIILTKERGLIRRIIITPTDSTNFVEEIRNIQKERCGIHRQH